MNKNKTELFFSGFLILFFNKRNQASLAKWLILGLAQGVYKIRLELHVDSESKKILISNITIIMINIY